MSTTSEALQWITDTLIDKRAGMSIIKKEKWNGVADSLYEISNTINLAVKGFKTNKAPDRHYSIIYNLIGDFEKILWQVYDRDKDYYTVRKFRKEFERAIHLVDKGCETVPEETSPETESGRKVLEDLEACAGKFRALSVTLKAVL